MKSTDVQFYLCAANHISSSVFKSEESAGFEVSLSRWMDLSGLKVQPAFGFRDRPYSESTTIEHEQALPAIPED